MNRSKKEFNTKSTENIMNNLNIFHCIWVFLCFTTLGSLGSQNAMLFRKYFYWNMSFSDPQIKGIPRKPNNIEFLICWNSVSSQNTRLNFFIWVSILILLPVKEF